MATNPLERIEQFARKKKAAEKKRESRKASDVGLVATKTYEFPKAEVSTTQMFTGGGADGVVQPEKPVGTIDTVQGARMIHEGETMYNNPQNGNLVVEPNVQTMKQPNFEQQAQLERMEATGIGGFEFGTGDEGVEMANPMDIPNPMATPTNTMVGDNSASDAVNPPAPIISTNIPTADKTEAPDLTTDVDTPIDNSVDTSYDPRQFLETTAQGKNPYITDVLDKAVSNIEDTNRMNLMYGAQKQASNPNLTTGAQNAMQTELASNASSARADALADASGKQADMMYTANKDLIAEDSRQDALAKQDAELADGYYTKAKELYTRMKINGFSNEDISNNSEYKDLMNQFYKLRGAESDADWRTQFESDMAETQSKFGLVDNKAQFEDNAIAIMNSLVDRDVKLNDNGSLPDEILNDEALIQNAANYLGLWDAYDTTTVMNALGKPQTVQTLKPEVEDWIKSNFGVKTKSDSTIASDYIWNEFVAGNEELMDNPEIRTMVDDWVKGNTGAGGFVVNEDGSVSLPKNYQLPWDDPYQKYGEFETVDGGEVVFDDDGNKSVLIDGTEYAYDAPIQGSDVRVGVGQANRVATYEDFDNAWANVLDSEKNMYLDTDGNFDMDKLEGLLNYGSVDKFPADGSFSDFTKYFDSGDVWENEIEGGNGNIGGISPTGDVDEGVLSGEGRHFWYEDKDGEWQALPVENSAFKNIWQQASIEMGRPLDSDEFGEWYKAQGSPALDKDGNIVEDVSFNRLISNSFPDGIEEFADIAKTQDEYGFLSGSTGVLEGDERETLDEIKGDLTPIPLDTLKSASDKEGRIAALGDVEGKRLKASDGGHSGLVLKAEDDTVWLYQDGEIFRYDNLSNPENYTAFLNLFDVPTTRVVV